MTSQPKRLLLCSSFHMLAVPLTQFAITGISIFICSFSRTSLRVVALIVSGLIIASEQAVASVGTAEQGFVGLRHNRPHSLHTVFQLT